MKISRRELAGLAAGAAVTRAQTREADSPEELLKRAQEGIRRSSTAIAKYQVPAETEPAFSFRA